MFIDPIASRFRQDATLVGLCDPSEVRRTFHQRRLQDTYGLEAVPTFEDFDLMLQETRPDCVTVCTPDYLHHDYIVKSLEFGADVISEKPLTTDAEKCRAIFAAVERTGRKVRTTFNMRWSPGITKVRQIIASGTIGRVRHVDFEYMLNTSHGADYFRRWHNEKEKSGGLLIHKSTHHFDVINWWLDAIPEMVFAQGGLVFYGKENALKRGDSSWTNYDRYSASTDPSDPFHLDIAGDSTMGGLYRDAEEETGYIRDKNVFREGIDIEDSMSVLVRYRTGEMLTYSLNAYCPREGFRASISGDRGRIEYEERHASHIVTGDLQITPSEGHQMDLTVQRHFSEPYKVEIHSAEGGHGGADPLLQEQMFSATPPQDSLMRGAGHEQGAASLLIGAAANLSMEKTEAIRISQLFSLSPNARHLHELDRDTHFSQH
jgi:predicted dehydrogenase